MTYRNANAIDAQIAQAQDARPICHDADLGIWIWPVLEDRLYRLALLDGDVERLGAGVESRILKTHVTNGGSVHQRHELLRIVDEQAVKEVGVLVLERRQIEIAVNVGLASPDHLERTLALLARVLHDVWDKTGEVLGDALLWGKREALTEGRDVSCHGAQRREDAGGH